MKLDGRRTTDDGRRTTDAGPHHDDNTSSGPLDPDELKMKIKLEDANLHTYKTSTVVILKVKVYGYSSAILFWK